ncbi:MAG: N-acetyltransferase [Flavobacterium sp. BFFFF1]|uniref:GNAT family N-acetyltransferase n=1 Tax=Flavobacterium sp. BFFFF1 TaxID=2015557 RepID=UPI000BCD9603|nr:GNAT family N-acetyltransferase [Flavobacterium sp. BFFFF1]OYU81235.1 MAG: N-acetyltransferase [Flavobacterium sp. BFFFF1]
MSVQIRRAAAPDIPAILDIVNHSILFSTSIYDYDARTLEQQQLWFAEKNALNFPVIVAEIDGKVAGFGTYGSFRVKVAYQYTVEHSVYVAEDFKGQGIGKLLLSELIELAKLDGFHVMIGCIDAANASSIGFHEKFGFKITGTIKEVGFKFGRWLDLVLMQLILKH